MDNSFQITDRHPNKNCYVRVPHRYNIVAEDFNGRKYSFEEHLAKIDTFVNYFFFQNEALLEITMCLLHLAIRQLPTGKILILIGKGEDGKTMHGNLEKCTLGSANVGNVNFSVFLDRTEFRRSTQSAKGKIAVRIQESQSDSPIQSEQFKKFITGEKVDTRVNYG